MKVTLFGPDINIEDLFVLAVPTLATTNMYVKSACKKVLILNESKNPKQRADFLETKFSFELYSLKCCTYKNPSKKLSTELGSVNVLDRV